MIRSLDKKAQGEFSLRLLLATRSSEQLRDTVPTVHRIFVDARAQVMEETLGNLSAFYAMFPGNHKFNVFPLWLAEDHHARLSSVFAPHIGHPHSEDLDSEYLNIFETRTRTPFFQDVYDNPDAEPVMPCEAAKPAIVVYGKQLGRKLTVCTDKHCPVHDPQAAAEAAAHPVPTMAPPPEVETEEEAAQRGAEHQQRLSEYEVEQERREEERKAEFDRQQKEYEAEQARRDKQRKARVATFERIIEQAPVSFSPAQMRVFLRLLIHLDYSFLEEVANHFANGDENSQQSDDEIVLAALDRTADEKLIGLALRLVLSDHIGIPHENQPDLLTEAEQVLAPKKPKPVKAKADSSNKVKPTAATVTAKKETTRKKVA